jgi:hypothetical protein
MYSLLNRSSFPRFLIITSRCRFLEMNVQVLNFSNVISPLGLLVERETAVWTAGVAFSLLTASRSALGNTQPPIQFFIMGYFHGVVKQPDRKADCCPPSHSEANNDGAMPPLPYTPSWRDA